MIEAYLKPLKELLELLFKCGPYFTERKERQLKHALARLYFLMIELRDSSNYFLCWLKHSQRYKHSRFYFGCALEILDSLNGIMTKVLELVDREFADDLTLSNLLRIENEDLVRRLHLLIGAKRLRLRMWEGILKELSDRNEEAGAQVRNQSLKKRDDSEVQSRIFLLPEDFTIPYDWDEFHRFQDEFDIEKILIPVEVGSDTIDQEIRKSEAAITQIDRFLEEYRPFLKEHVSMEDLLGGH